MKLLEIKPSTRKGKKLMAVFKKDDGKTITTHFGSANMRDFTLINDRILLIILRIVEQER